MWKEEAISPSAPLRIRDACPDDVPALAALHVATFKEAHGRLGAPTFELRERQWRAAFVLREWHRQGIGRRLVEHVARRFLERGLASMLLFGDARNPSNGFYERLGAERLLSPEGEFHGGYGWRDLHRLSLHLTP